MIQNHLLQLAKRPNNIQISPDDLYDMKGLAGIHLPQPPTAPARVPKDVDWWRRNLGGQNMKPQITGKEYLGDAYRQLMKLFSGA